MQELVRQSLINRISKPKDINKLLRRDFQKMKKKILGLLLTMVMIFSFIPMTAFADDGFAITNGTPKSDKEKNHDHS